MFRRRKRTVEEIKQEATNNYRRRRKATKKAYSHMKQMRKNLAILGNDSEALKAMEQIHDLEKRLFDLRNRYA